MESVRTGDHRVHASKAYSYENRLGYFPAEHWVHIRTTNPVESTFAAVRLTRGYVSRNIILVLVFPLGLSAEKHWVRLRGFKRLGEVIRGVKFSNGVPVVTSEEQVEEGSVSRSAT